MGREYDRSRKHVSLYVVGLILLTVSACVSTALVVRQEGHSFLQQSQGRIRRGDFDGALKESQDALARSPESSPADEALYTMGLVYAHYGNPKKDYQKARSLFTRVVYEFPNSPRATEATIWINVLEAVEKEKQPDLRKREQLLMQRGDFDGALKASQAVLARSPKSPPGDEALFTMGLIYAHNKNPNQDYPKALDMFMRLIKEFPQSPRAEESRVWTGVLESIEKSKQVDIQIEEKTKELKK